MNNDHEGEIPENNKPESIARLLTHSAEKIDTKTIEGLRRARNVALNRQSIHKPYFALSSGHTTHLLTPHSPQQWVAAIILLIAVLVSLAGYWHHGAEHDSNHHDMSHLDIAILTDDLPMEIFLDP